MTGLCAHETPDKSAEDESESRSARLFQWSESRSARLFQCTRCHSLATVCSCCDRGQVYCLDCAFPAQQEAKKRAAKRYQSSLKGRLKHAARQHRYRERQRLVKEKVTHQGCRKLPDVVTMEEASLSEKKQLKTSASMKFKSIICEYCSQFCSSFLRNDVLSPRNISSRKTIPKRTDRLEQNCVWIPLKDSIMPCNA